MKYRVVQRKKTSCSNHFLIRITNISSTHIWYWQWGHNAHTDHCRGRGAGRGAGPFRSCTFLLRAQGCKRADRGFLEFCFSKTLLDKLKMQWSWGYWWGEACPRNSIVPSSATRQEPRYPAGV